MFAVDEASAAAIKEAFFKRGELAAIVELRRRYPALTDNEQARQCVRSIAAWQPIPPVRQKPPTPCAK